ncbi:MAG: hypothetical protein HY821_18085 [Acidobacteria bacterium]|nr:hypothetical protein [Acidobacteriota bacterium]
MRNECAHLEEVLLAARTGSREWDGHLAECAECRDAVAVAAALEGARDEVLAGAALPDAGIVWRRAQFRARREAIQAAGRPITVAQVVAFAVAMGLVGACVGATSESFQAVLAWVSGHWGTAFRAAIADHWMLAVGAVAAMVALPGAIYALVTALSGQGARR